MELELWELELRSNTFSYNHVGGWSVKQFPPANPDNTLALVFATPELVQHPQILDQLHEQYPGLKIAGCSSSGNILSSEISDESVTVTLIQFDSTPFRVESLSCNDPSESRAVGAALAHKLGADDLRAVLVFSDGLNVVGSELVFGLKSVLPASVRVAGGLAGDMDRFRSTFTVDTSGLKERTVVAVGLYGKKLVVTNGTAGGWIPFSGELKVTSAAGNIVRELDGRPALSCYKSFLGQSASELPAVGLKFPLLVRNCDTCDIWTIRSVLGINESDQSLIFAGNIDQGAVVRLMYADRNAVINAAGTACDLAYARASGSKVAIGVSCVGRRLVLGERVNDELAAASASLPTGTRLIGFYSYGEICPHRSGELEFHNQSFTVTVLGEAA